MDLQPARTCLMYYGLLMATLLSGTIASAQLTARFTMDKTGGCSPVIINFSNQTTGASPNASYKWDFGNGNTSTLTEGGAVYTDERTYTVTLTVTDGSNQSTQQQQVTVYSPPVVDFSVSPAKTCLGMPVTFNANATAGSGNISFYTWDFGDGSTANQYSTGQTHTYATEITAPVSLTVTNTYGCHTTLHRSNVVTIIPALVSGFTADKKVLCLVTDPIQFTNSSTGPGVLDYKWDFGDATSSTALNPTHIFNKKGNYTVSLTVHSSEGCTITSTQSNPINVANYTSNFDIPSPICVYSTVQFNNLSSPTPDNTQWQLDGAPFPWFSYYSQQWAPQNADIGTHTVKLINTFGTCPQSISKQISVKDVPHLTGFTADITSPCGSPVLVNFKDPTPGDTKWNWNFDYYGYTNATAATQNPSYTYTSDGYHYINLTVFNADGCTASTSQSIFITRPSVGIYMDPPVLSVCSSLMTITFHTSSSEALTAASWNFGDGSTSTDLNPTHGFKNTGNYTVTLNYTTASGCKGTTTFFVNSQPVPNPVAVYTTPGNPASCNQPITVTFTTYSSEPLTTTTWALGDGSSSTAASPTHTYTNVGQYVATLNYVTQSGCKGTAYSNVITVDPKITTLDFTINPNPVCGNSLTSFTTTPNKADIQTWTWDFGDGASNYGPANTTHSYTAAGTYTIKLYAINKGGCDTTLTKTVTVKLPFPQIVGHTNTCDGTRGDVTFTQNSIGANSIIWNFGDGSTSTTPGDQATITHTYKKTGNYSPTLTAVNGACSLTIPDWSGVLVLVKQKPVLTGDKTAVCSNNPVNIQITNLDKNPYQSDNVLDYYSYYQGYTFTGSQYGDGTPFTGSRIDPNNGYNYRWTTTYNATINSFQTGEKGIRFILTSLGFGCQDTTNTMPLAIKGAVGGFKIDADKLCYQSPVVLEDTSHSTSDNTILSWKWDFGDGNSSTQTKGGKITHTYTNPGSYFVNMQITDAAGCSSNVPSSQYVQVNGPKASFYPSGTDVHLNTTVYFYNNTNDYGNSNTVYTWDFGDGVKSTDPYPSHTYTVPGTYTVTMSATNPTLPCASAATPVTIIVRNFNSHFQFNSSYVAGSCPPMLVSFTNTSYNAVTVAWDFGDGNTAGNVNYPSHVYEKPGTYIVTLTVYTYNGLQGQYIDSVIIRQPAVVIPKMPPESCIGSTITLASNVTYASSYTWDFGDGSIIPSTDGNATHKYLTAGSYTATLLVQNDAGCVSDTTLPAPVKIRPNPTAVISPASPVLCKGDSQPLTASGGSIYSWSPATGLSDPNSSTPIAYPTVTTDYVLTIKDDIGCQNTAPLTILVVQPGNLQLPPTAAICAGDPLPIKASGETIYKWIDNTNGLDHTNIPNPIATPSGDITYTVQGSDDHYCFVHTKSIVVTVHPLPTVNAGPDVMVEAGYDATLNAEGSSDVIRWQWLPEKYLSCYNCASPVCLPLATTQYVVRVENRYCKAYDTVVVAVDCQESHVRIPNAFTPNGDGANDVFMIKGISIVKHMVIFGRWGEKVFERDNFIAGDRASCWDGTWKGQKCAPGAYVYFVEMECPSGGTFSRKGSFILVR